MATTTETLLARVTAAPQEAAILLDFDGVLAPIVERWELRPATATSLAAIGITATAGVVAYAFHGDVEPAYALLLGVPAALGAAGGSALQQRLPVRTLSLLFAALLVAIAIRMLLQ